MGKNEKMMALYEVGLKFEIDDSIPPPRNSLHSTLERVRAIVVVARTIEEAESYADQIRIALIEHADK